MSVAGGLMIGIEFGRPSSLKPAQPLDDARQAARKDSVVEMVVVPLLQRHRILTQVSGDHLEVIGNDLAADHRHRTTPTGSSTPSPT
ncbi:hypothetical protein SALBM311S_10844 [Streptomyces alboniger]